MKRNPSLKLTLLALLVLLLGACTGEKGRQETAGTAERERMEGEAEVNPMVEQLDREPDAAFRATLVEQKDDSIVLRTEAGQHVTLGHIEATMGGEMKGSLTTGNEYSVFPDWETNSVRMAINVSELRGQWFYDMQQHRGMKFEPRGAISSINTQDISFREWKLLNGRLYIYYLTVDMVSPDRSEYLVQPAEIVSLSKNRLVLEFLGKTYNCQRQQKAIKMKF